MVLHFASTDDQQMVLAALKTHLSYTSVRDLYAFQNKERYPATSGWPIYSVEKELERQGIHFTGEGFWALVENAQYKKSPTYPSQLLIPRSISKSKLFKSG